ncbi:MAG: sensor histidine kinase [Cyclobacteriaceae bacterium]|nr:sensor histidine kinase [Cyclobacteriaceae bacterium HetDA_MAG_MS6]
MAQDKLIEQLQLKERTQRKYVSELEEKVRQLTAALQKRNEENQILLKEIHHRVKNNLQMISSLLSMQNRRVKEHASKEVLSLTRNRVLSIGLIHEHLYHHDDFSKINLKEYIENLIKMLFKSLHMGANPKLSLSIPVCQADIDTAIPIGVMLNELITNSIRYAFKGHKAPKLSVLLFEDDGVLHLQVSDNGPGTSTNHIGFGWSIINATLEGLQGQVRCENMNGFHVFISLNRYIIMINEGTRTHS